MTNKSKCKRRQNKNKKRSNKDSNVEEKELTAVEKSEEELSNSHASNSTTVTFQLSPVVANMIQIYMIDIGVYKINIIQWLKIVEKNL
ncbi:2913_t:CDS:2 [Funneliformis geosporum]|uniref:2913_t:CDS:1 n=1 Tax=Funneliformis geosporum TaxID=1117311 RepID=A0A9W4SSJ0_9GLOM|nr:2913_t:CDS:2 [Funneliformis geosporum]